LLEFRRQAEQKEANRIQREFIESAKKSQEASDKNIATSNAINHSIRLAAWASAIAAFSGVLIQLWISYREKPVVFSPIIYTAHPSENPLISKK
jgi:hypothetical protein